MRIQSASKVPAVTLIFGIIKTAAMTLGETGGDSISATLTLGYLIGTGIFLMAFGRARNLSERYEVVSSFSLLGSVEIQ